jgi:hypothetical protein
MFAVIASDAFGLLVLCLAIWYLYRLWFRASSTKVENKRDVLMRELNETKSEIANEELQKEVEATKKKLQRQKKL